MPDRNENDMTEVSICMATFNGEAFLEKQLISIFHQMTVNDELILVDDCSTDNTVDIAEALIKQFTITATIIRNGANKGHVGTFEKAIEMANGQIIVMSDQDDLWPLGRLDAIKHSLTASDIKLIAGKSQLIDKCDRFIRNPEIHKIYSLKNYGTIFGLVLMFFGRQGYYGCAMAFKKEFKKVLLPFPSFVYAHDIWIAICANVFGCVGHLDRVVVNRRVHNNNTSLRTNSIAKKILFRLKFVALIISALFRRLSYASRK